uniref:HAT C-terminal dimerisation domain-containing protein n=1 Tax=Chenopodium quinoa TaxID=63459 RepID=A0A803MG68_CHEQI
MDDEGKIGSFSHFYNQQINIVDASSKRHDELQAAQKAELANKIANDEVQTGRGLNQIGNLQRAADTRWKSHLNSIYSLVRTFASTGTVLVSIIKEGNSEQRANADAAYDTLILTGWDDLFQKVKSFCEKHNVDIPDMTTLYTAASDLQLQEINNRFDEQMIDILILSATLDLKDSFKSFNVDKICHLVQRHYPEDFSEQEKYQLEWKLSTYPLVDRLIRLVLTLPVSTATCERDFYAMNIVKTQLMSKMEDDFLRDVLVVYTQKKRLFNNNVVAPDANENNVGIDHELLDDLELVLEVSEEANATNYNVETLEETSSPLRSPHVENAASHGQPVAPVAIHSAAATGSFSTTDATISADTFLPLDCGTQ